MTAATSSSSRFPFTDLSAAKRRPVLALTASDRYGDFIGMPVTSRPQHEHAISISTADLADGALPVASWIRTDRIVTLSAGLALRSIARLQEAVVGRAIRQLCDRLGRP